MNKLYRNEKGLVSIIIVTVLILVITLITLGFASLARREQRQALDQQQSIQARLAAEAVIDDKIAEYRANPDSIVDVNTCGEPEATFGLDSDEIQTTCFQIDTAPGPLEYDEVETGTSTIAWLDPGDTPLDRIVITWQNTASATGNTCLSNAYGDFPTALADSNNIGMLRFDLSRVGSSGSFSRDSLKDGFVGGVLQPKSSSPTTSLLEYATINNPASQPVIFGECGSAPPNVIDPYIAHATIDLPNNNDSYVLRLRGVYRPSQVKVVGLDQNDNAVEFSDAQISIEATARVNDIVQRIQVRVPASTPPAELLPDNAIHVTNGGLCKRIQTEPSSTTLPSC